MGSGPTPVRARMRMASAPVAADHGAADAADHKPHGSRHHRPAQRAAHGALGGVAHGVGLTRGKKTGGQAG